MHQAAVPPVHSVTTTRIDRVPEPNGRKKQPDIQDRCCRKNRAAGGSSAANALTHRRCPVCRQRPQAHMGDGLDGRSSIRFMNSTWRMRHPGHERNEVLGHPLAGVPGWGLESQGKCQAFVMFQEEHIRTRSGTEP